MVNEITTFKGVYSFLSNFYVSEVVLDGVVYKTAEHAFQAGKAANTVDRIAIIKCDTPGGAKRKGRLVKCRPDWEDIKVQHMYRVLRAKFKHEPLKSNLLLTGTRQLIEGNTWHDEFWGVCSCPNHGKGKNKLGELLMQVREELRDEIKREMA